MGPDLCTELCKNCSTSKPTDSELRNHRKPCLVHEP